MSKKIEQPAYWGVIPAPVRYDDRLPANAKLLYGEISALCDRKGFCWAKNDYFAELYGWSSDTVTRLIRKLRDAGYLTVEMVPTATGSERRIFAGVCTRGVGKNAETPLGKKVGGVSAKKSTPHNIRTDNYNITPIPPLGEGVQKGVHKGVPREQPDWKPERFAGMWNYYPAKGRRNKQRAMDAWDKLKPDDALIARIGRALEKLLATEEWQRGIGIPHVATFLNGQRWKDADELDAPSPAVPASTRVQERKGDYEI